MAININHFNRILAVKQCGGCGDVITDRLGYSKKLCPKCVQGCNTADRQRRIKKWQAAMKIKYGGGRKGLRFPFKEFNKELICPRCKIEARGVTKNGTNMPYCNECQTNITKYFHVKNPKPKDYVPKKRKAIICPRCKVNEKFINGNGKYGNYCQDCHNEVTRINAKKYREKNSPTKTMKGICPKCNVNKRGISAKGKMKSYCNECYALVVKEYIAKKRLTNAKSAV